ncbi:ATP-binding cassette domain-containing protein [Nocardioides sp.]|uniref:ABC transporter ATP-binding protein n=1 Tax=Nocardioides sp. TaxID=35761 RepID=UPI0026188B9F|nr:ATP-binding cassette domain-containing protein [Nocardioides sp.]MDI6911549.1 ATP-binding cassette domain-containing protein [Nocardioides sp.]
MIRAHALTKRFATEKGQSRVAVDGIDFVVEPGRVTGFLGPNGAGKSTTMRMILGLDAPTSGTVSVNGHRYAAAPAPLREIGALLDAHAIHPGRSARDHLRWMAASNGIPTTRVGEVLELVGLEAVAGQRAGRYSLGMGQRLGIAAAMLGDPPVVVLDEPVNGLDPEGIRWVRTFARQLADEGRTVFISSHLMSEMALMADHLLVIGRGSILADCSMSEFMSDHAASYVRVKAPALGDVGNLLTGRGLEVSRVEDELRVVGLDASAVGELVFRHGLVLHELTLVLSSLEDAFMALTADSVEYHAATEPTATEPTATERARSGARR